VAGAATPDHLTVLNDHSLCSSSASVALVVRFLTGDKRDKRINGLERPRLHQNPKTGGTPSVFYWVFAPIRGDVGEMERMTGPPVSRLKWCLYHPWPGMLQNCSTASFLHE
jgi:hypothetical protein